MKLIIYRTLLLFCLFLAFLYPPEKVAGKRNKGQIYEDQIRAILEERNLLPEELKGNDVGFIHKGSAFYVEVKNKNARDFGQKGLIWDKETGWRWRRKGVVSDLYDQFGVIDMIDKDFIPRRHSIPKERITGEDKDYDQGCFEKSGIRLDKVDYLYEFYARKKCFYIQIQGKGFFYLKQDPAGLGVPRFRPQLTLRMRAKTHHSDPIYAYSFFAVIQLNRRKIPESPYDLEEKVGKFPVIEK